MPRYLCIIPTRPHPSHTPPTLLTHPHRSTVRLWNTAKKGTQLNVICPKTKIGRKTVPTACSFSRDGIQIACGCSDGSIQMWDTRRFFVSSGSGGSSSSGGSSGGNSGGSSGGSSGGISSGGSSNNYINNNNNKNVYP